MTTALFSVCLLKKQIQPMQWISLLLLTMGVALVQLPADTFSGEVKEENEIEVSEEKSKVLYCYHILTLRIYNAKLLFFINNPIS